MRTLLVSAMSLFLLAGAAHAAGAPRQALVQKRSQLQARHWKLVKRALQGAVDDRGLRRMLRATGGSVVLGWRVREIRARTYADSGYLAKRLVLDGNNLVKEQVRVTLDGTLLPSTRTTISLAQVRRTEWQHLEPAKVLADVLRWIDRPAVAEPVEQLLKTFM